MAQKEFVDVQVELLPMGPPAGRAVQYRVSGPDVPKVKELAQQLAAKIGNHPLLEDIGFNWMEPARVVKLEVAGQGAATRRHFRGHCANTERHRRRHHRHAGP